MEGRRARVVRQRLESLAAAGVTALPKAGRPRRGRAESPQAANSLVASARDPASITAAVPAGLALLREQVATCTRCAELAAGRTRTVFGSGPADARLCFFGEAPGADEDASGEPFVGRAGQLLTKIIEACSLRREDVYIMNVLKCRPPGNRQPLPDEVANCRPFFEAQLAAIGPEFICCLGSTAARALLQTGEPIGKLRRRWFEHVIRRPAGDVTARVLCTYHPSYLLRNPVAKRDVWEDMKMLMREMGIAVG